MYCSFDVFAQELLYFLECNHQIWQWFLLDQEASYQETIDISHSTFQSLAKRYDKTSYIHYSMVNVSWICFYDAWTESQQRAIINSALFILRIMPLSKKSAGATAASSYEKTSFTKQLPWTADGSSLWDNFSDDNLISFPSTFTVLLIIENVPAWSFFLSVILDNDCWPLYALFFFRLQLVNPHWHHYWRLYQLQC